MPRGIKDRPERLSPEERKALRDLARKKISKVGKKPVLDEGIDESDFKNFKRKMPPMTPGHFLNAPVINDPGEGYEGSPDMYPDYEEDKKDLKKGRKPKHMGSMMGGSVNKYKSGSYITVKTKLGRNKKTKIC